MTIEGQTWTIKATVKMMITRDDLIILAKNRARASQCDDAMHVATLGQATAPT